MFSTAVIGSPKREVVSLHLRRFTARGGVGVSQDNNTSHSAQTFERRGATAWVRTCQSFSDLSGKSICSRRAPAPTRASTTALASAGGAPTVPLSPRPLVPSVLNGAGVHVSPTRKVG